MAVAAAGNQSEQAAATREPRTSSLTAANRTRLDPRLFMAARRGDSKQLKHLLQLEEEDDDDIRVDVVDHPMPDDTAVNKQQQQQQPILRLHAADGGGVTMEGDSLLHVVAACGDGGEFIRCANMIVRRHKEKKRRQVLQARNSNGDTPLHCATGAGNAEMVSCLIALAAGDAADMTTLVRMQNKCGETALHHAIRAASNSSKQASIIDRLMAVDPELACVPHEEGACSPLYLAISLGELEIAWHLFRRTGGNLSYSGPHGRNVLHAAVPRGQALPMVLDWLKELKTVGTMQQCRRRHDAGLLLQQLTSQRDEHADGSSPLHLAAALDGWSSGRFLGKWFPHIWTWSESATELLLDANESTAYQPDNTGCYPVHVAAAAGSLGVLRVLLGRCPDTATLRDGHGRTFLHVAVEGQSADVVGYAISHLSPSMLNAQDKDGDTALHKAVRVGDLGIFNCLIRNRQVRLDVQNKEALTPLDLSWSMRLPGANYRMNPDVIIRRTLEYAGAPHGGLRSDLFGTKHLARKDKDRSSETLRDSTQAMGIVSVLIATVTFASAFTLPGGYRSDDGTPVLAGSYAFDAFVVADTLAFICSSLATFCLVYAGMPFMHLSIRHRYMIYAALLLQPAARSFVAAFGLGLYLVLAPDHYATAAAVHAIAYASLFYGNTEASQYVSVLKTVRARLGTSRIPAARFHARRFLFRVLPSYWCLLIIFGLPPILKEWETLARFFSVCSSLNYSRG